VVNDSSSELDAVRREVNEVLHEAYLAGRLDIVGRRDGQPVYSHSPRRVTIFISLGRRVTFAIRRALGFTTFASATDELPMRREMNIEYMVLLKDGKAVMAVKRMTRAPEMLNICHTHFEETPIYFGVLLYDIDDLANWA
jgi:hypothetical protein